MSLADCTGALESFPVPNPGNVANKLTGLSVLDASDAWAVGVYANVPPAWLFRSPQGAVGFLPPTLVAPLVLRWSGRSWDRIPAANPFVNASADDPRGGTSFEDVAATSADDAWAVGGGQSPVIEHWDGHEWSVVPSPQVNLVDARLVTVSADAEDDAWAAGSGGPEEGIGPVIEHWDGRVWMITPVQGVDRRYSVVSDIAALSPTDVWVVGQEWDGPLMLHWDGKNWNEVASPKMRATRLASLSAVGADDVWAVGTSFADVDGHGPAQGLIQHWDGTRWSLVTVPAIDIGTSLGSVSSSGPHDVWVSGTRTRSDGSAAEGLLVHFDGSRWVEIAQPGVQHVVWQIATSGEGGLWAIGSNYAGSPSTAFVGRICP